MARSPYEPDRTLDMRFPSPEFCHYCGGRMIVKPAPRMFRNRHDPKTGKLLDNHRTIECERRRWWHEWRFQYHDQYLINLTLWHLPGAKPAVDSKG